MLYWGLMLLWVHVHLGKKSKGFKDRTGSTQTHSWTKPCAQLPSLTCSRHGTFRACPLGLWGVPKMISHMTGLLTPPFSLNISAPSTLKAALHVRLTYPHGQRWLFPRSRLGKPSEKDELQSHSIICILSAKLKDNHALRGHPSGSESAGSCCHLLQGKTLKRPARKYPSHSGFGSGWHYITTHKWWAEYD